MAFFGFLVAAPFLLSSLDLRGVEQDWGSAQRNRSVDGNRIQIAGKSFATGIGTHANSSVEFELGGRVSAFHAVVGLDDEIPERAPGSVTFAVIGDGKKLFESGVMRRGTPGKAVDLDLRGVKRLRLVVGDADDGINYDHADWADASIELVGGAPKVVMAEKEKAEILTPKPGPRPRLTGPQVLGVRPGNPIVHWITATGERPMRFSAAKLPSGVRLDASTGALTGSIPNKGEFEFKVRAENGKGAAERTFRLVIGDRIALTPPMGWNSWNCWGGAVDQEKVLRSAKAMADKLRNHGWSYVNTDDGWQHMRGGKHNAIMPNKKFPDISAMFASIHAFGLKAGIYSTPWEGSYQGYIGGSAPNPDGTSPWLAQANENGLYPRAGEHYRFAAHSFEANDVRQWVEWGVDYLKYDWNPLDIPHVSAMSKLLRGAKRDIVYSLSNSANVAWGDDYAQWSELWRTTGDITDTWGSMKAIIDSQEQWQKFGGPGHWNDPDMLIVGNVGWGPSLHPTHLTPNEQYTHISFWCMVSAPLLLGCDLEHLDPFTLSLLTNDEVLDVDQDPLGAPAVQVENQPEYQIWSKKVTGGTVIGVFSRSQTPVKVKLDTHELGLSVSAMARDLWRQKDIGLMGQSLSVEVPRHGVKLLRITGKS